MLKQLIIDYFFKAKNFFVRGSNPFGVWHEVKGDLSTFQRRMPGGSFYNNQPIELLTRQDIAYAYRCVSVLNGIITVISDRVTNAGLKVKTLRGIVNDEHPYLNTFYPNVNSFVKDFALEYTLFENVFIYCDSVDYSIFSKIRILKNEFLNIEIDNNVDILTISSIKDKIKKIYYTESGRYKEIDKSKLFIVSRYQDLMYSTVQSLNSDINIIKLGLDTTKKTYQKNISGGIFPKQTQNKEFSFGENNGLTEFQIVQYQKDLEKYQLSGDHLLMVGNTPMDFLTFNAKISDLMLDKNIGDAIRRVCFCLNFPVSSLSLVDTTFSNKESGDKEIYESCIIPVWKAIEVFLNSLIENEKYNFSFDYSNITSLQPDYKIISEKQRNFDDRIIKINKEIANGTLTYEIALNMLKKDMDENTAKSFLNKDVKKEEPETKNVKSWMM